MTSPMVRHVNLCTLTEVVAIDPDPLTAQDHPADQVKVSATRWPRIGRAEIQIGVQYTQDGDGFHRVLEYVYYVPPTPAAVQRLALVPDLPPGLRPALLAIAQDAAFFAVPPTSTPVEAAQA